MKQLVDHITRIHPLSEGAVFALEESFTEKQLPKNEWLLTEGKICRHLYFLQTGSIRGYYLLEGKEITHWFAFSDDFVTSFYSFITRQPAVENLQALEDCTLWAISKEKLEALFDRHTDIERLMRMAYERYYIRLEERNVNPHFKTAAE